jgi:hypothetical protein
MKATIKCYDLTPLKKKLIKADIEHTKWLIYDELAEFLNKAKNDKNLGFKFLNFIRKASKMADITIDVFITQLETIVEAEMFVITYKDIDKTTAVVTLEIPDYFFDIPKMLPFGGFFTSIFQTEKSFIKKLEESVKDWKVKYEMKVEK